MQRLLTQEKIWSDKVEPENKKSLSHYLADFYLQYTTEIW
jgi:hypothetical protein